MLSKCPFDPYAYYDPWGNRHLVFSHAALVRLARHLDGMHLMAFCLRNR